MVIIRSAIYTIMVFISCACYSCIVVLVRPFGFHTSFYFAQNWARLVIWMGGVFCGLKCEFDGTENLPAENSVVYMKHSSAYETIVQIAAFPPQCWVMKKELLWVPFFGWGLAALQPIAVDRGAGRAAVRQVLEQGKKRLTDGRWVIIFPEGTRLPPGETRRYGISGTLLAQENNKLIVPVAHNAGDYWPRRSWLKRAGIVRFSIGPPVDPANRNPREVNQEIQRWIEDRVSELRREAGFI